MGPFQEGNPWSGEVKEVRFNILPYLSALRDWWVGKQREKRESYYWYYECGCLARGAYDPPYCLEHGLRLKRVRGAIMEAEFYEMVDRDKI